MGPTLTRRSVNNLGGDRAAVLARAKPCSADLHDAPLDGRLIRRGDPGYDAARRVWNGRVDRRPHLVLQAASAQDVARGVGYAREAGLPLAVRAGGHHPAGFGAIDDGIVIDLSPMNEVRVDHARRTARVGAGVTAGEFLRQVYACDSSAPSVHTAPSGWQG